MYSDCEDVYDHWFEMMFRIESVGSNDPDDPGGWTQYGITERTLRDWLDISPGEPTPEISYQSAKHLYKANVWDKLLSLRLHPLAHWFTADAVVNHGYRKAIELLQGGHSSLIADGDWGPNSRRAHASYDTQALIFLFCQRYRENRVKFYFDIIDERPKSRKFIEGWMNRLFKVVEGAWQAGLINPPMAVLEHHTSEPANG